MNKAEISAAGFAAVRRSPRRLIANIQGTTKSGKTRLALTAKKPCGYLAIEVGGDEGVVDHFIPIGADSTEDIQIAHIQMPSPVYPMREDYKDDRAYQDAISIVVQDAANIALDQFYKAYYASLANMATTIVDTGSDLWEIIRLANFGRLEKVPQLAYAQVNKQMDKLIDDAFSYQGSVLFLHHLKEKWITFTNDKGKEQGRPSGVFEMAGYGGVKKKVQATIELWRDDLQEPDNDTGRMVRFNSSILESRHNPDVMGQQFHNDFDFADLGVAIIAGSKKSDWQ